MKFKFRFTRARSKPILCDECGLGGLTLVRQDAKIKGTPSIYVHESAGMCDAARRRDKIDKALALRAMRGRINILKERLDSGRED